MELKRPTLLAAASLLISPGALLGQGGPKWEVMDYGPFLSASIEVEEGNIACKGLAIPLGDTPEARPPCSLTWTFFGGQQVGVVTV